MPIRTMFQHRDARRRVSLTVLCVAIVGFGVPRAHASWCEHGVWVDAMLGSYHIDPDPSKHFEPFNPGIGVECYFSPQWGATAGYFRNSIRRPSFYGGAIWAPEFVHWGGFRVAAMGGMISGYHYGRWGIGHHRTVGPVLAPVLMTNFKRVGTNFILIPPIPSEKLPFTVGFQVKIRID
ncbi:hypothetical protein [Mycetohabitans sp. B46]|uniref:hypothetical protein n=1 Tax=Mycetohabitans sp. B46 TaxID=2772536 RepID=UPI00307F88C4